MPTVTVRPNGTDINHGSVTGAASAHAATSDDSDSSYITTTPANRYTQLRFPNPSLPSGGRWKTVRGRQRTRSTTSSGRGATFLEVNFGVALSILQMNRPFFVSGSFADISTAVVQMPSGNPTAVMFGAVHDGTAGFNLVAAEYYVDFVYAAQPLCTVVGPSGTIVDTTQPALQWAHTPGADGGGQSQAQVRVFSVAQYGAAGFNPATSAAVWSTDLSGSQSSVTPAVQLIDGIYRVYVRSAQAINGQPHWSDWAYSGFTISTDPPDPPTITATPDDARARNRLVVTIDPAEASVVQVQRSADSGATWRPVRGATRINVVGSTWVGYDEDTAGSGKATVYRAQAIAPGVNGDVASAWSTTASATWTSASVWLKDPARPSRNRTVDIEIPVAPVTRPARVTEHEVLGRARPIPVSDVRGSARGSLTVQTATGDELDALLSMLDDADVLLLQAPEAYRIGSVYVVCGDVTETPYATAAPGPLRSWSFPFTVVDEPADSGVEPRGGLTIDDLGELYEYPSDIPPDLTFDDFV